MVTRKMAMVAVGLAVMVPGSVGGADLVESPQALPPSESPSATPAHPATVAPAVMDAPPTATVTTAAAATAAPVLDATPLVAPLQVVQPVNVPLAAVDSRAAAREVGEAALVARPDGAAAIAASNPMYVDAPPPPSGPSDAALAALRGCESGGDYAAVSGGGAYRGAYQFARSTWDSLASRWFAHLVGLDPAAAAPADQDAMARALFTERGWAPWPTCGLGL